VGELIKDFKTTGHFSFHFTHTSHLADQSCLPLMSSLSSFEVGIPFLLDLHAPQEARPAYFNF
jgi:hypothetical protein